MYFGTSTKKGPGRRSARGKPRSIPLAKALQSYRQRYSGVPIMNLKVRREIARTEKHGGIVRAMKRIINGK